MLPTFLERARRVRKDPDRPTKACYTLLVLMLPELIRRQVSGQEHEEILFSMS